ncbi:MAG TPA: hypothetical protein PLG91_06620 [Ferruginibacter sp.]|nr:hypothetical protein [Ferruginibacter sp.]
MKHTHRTFFFLSCLTGLLAACTKSEPADNGTNGISYSCTGISPKFSTDIQPILTGVCSINSNCHGTGSLNTGGPLTNQSEVSAKAGRIKAAILSGAMPQNGSLTQSQVNAFLCWIDSGSPDN